jgi:hypothetical protein
MLQPAIVTTMVGKTGIWSAMIQWPYGYRFVSGITAMALRDRVEAVCYGIGRSPLYR